MLPVGTSENPLRVAIIGAGPAGFYAADALLKQDDPVAQVDLFDKLPTPHGLVRAGVAPDHQKIKNVTRVYDRTASHEHFRFFGNVELGKHVTLEDLRRHYHQICFTTGAQIDRRLGIPGEDLEGSHSATDFVAWYNCHPDYCDLDFDLSAEAVAVIGVGNVAVDVARILCRTPEELAKTDIGDHALEKLRESNIKTVYMLGRRGPVQAAFTNPEVKELGELEGADVHIPADEAALDPLSQQYLDANPERTVQRNVEIVQDFARREPTGKPKTLVIRFLVSPVEILGDEAGRVRGLRIVRNRLYENEKGSLRPKATDEYETLPVQLVFRSIGYTGVPIPGVPFNERWGVISNEQGRVTNAETGEQVVGAYTAGWIKRGATGVIGTNKADAQETVACMIADAKAGMVLDPAHPAPEAIEALLRERRPEFFSYADWQRVDALETARGAPHGRPRIKYITADEMLDALGRPHAS